MPKGFALFFILVLFTYLGLPAARFGASSVYGTQAVSQQQDNPESDSDTSSSPAGKVQPEKEDDQHALQIQYSFFIPKIGQQPGLAPDAALLCFHPGPETPPPDFA